MHHDYESGTTYNSANTGNNSIGSNNKRSSTPTKNAWKFQNEFIYDYIINNYIYIISGINIIYSIKIKSCSILENSFMKNI